MAGDDQNMKAVFDEALRSSVTIFAFFESVPGTPARTKQGQIQAFFPLPRTSAPRQE